jgi:hypothetical protein
VLSSLCPQWLLHLGLLLVALPVAPALPMDMATTITVRIYYPDASLEGRGEDKEKRRDLGEGLSFVPKEFEEKRGDQYHGE